MVIENGNWAEYAISRPKQIFMAVARFFSLPLIEFVLKVLNRGKVVGAENLPMDRGGVLIPCNHVSWVDTLLVPIFAINRFSTIPYCSPAKEELFRFPIGPIIRMWGSFPVKRRSHDIASMRRMAYYASHYRVMIFPEGTRSRTGKLLKGRPGAGWVAYQSKATVVPALVINTDKYFWPSRKRPWFGVPYTLVFGEPLDLARFYEMPESKETSQAIVNEIMAAIAALKEKHKELYIDFV